MRIVFCKGVPYKVDELEDDRGCYIWNMLSASSEVYHVWQRGCTCPAPKPCKHMEAVTPPEPPPVKRLEPTDRRHSRG